MLTTLYFLGLLVLTASCIPIMNRNGKSMYPRQSDPHADALCAAMPEALYPPPMETSTDTAELHSVVANFW